MILQRLHLLLPSAWSSEQGTLHWIWWLSIALAGAMVYLLGARFSRGLVTLALVTLGAFLGKLIPPALGTHIDPAAGCIVGALVLGVLAFVFHRFLIAWSLGLLTGLCVVLGLFVHATTPAAWTWPSLSHGLSPALELCAAQLGTDTVQRMAALGGIASLAATALAFVFPRIGLCLFWSLLGLMLMLTSLLGYSAAHTSDLLTSLSARDTQTQLIALAALLLTGFVIQWPQTGKRKAPAPEPAPAAPAPAPEPAVAG